MEADMDQSADRPCPLARHDALPTFAEPWQAEVLVLAEALVERGVIGAAAWAAALGAALKEEPEHDDPREHYYRAVLLALERLMTERGGLAPDLLSARTEAWRRAYLRTPHGQPVELARGLGPER
jgi:nitrile hydratase accessory protein